DGLRDVVDEWHGLVGIADVFVVSGGFLLRRVEREHTVAVEIENFLFGRLRWPGIILAPDICAGFEDVGLGQFSVGVSFQVLLEKRKNDVLAVVITGVRDKTDAAEMIAVEAPPAAMNPGSDDEGVENFGVVAIDGGEERERALQVFGIEPAADGEHGAMNILDVVGEVARLPVVVVGVVMHLVAPQLFLAA